MRSNGHRWILEAKVPFLGVDRRRRCSFTTQAEAKAMRDRIKRGDIKPFGPDVLTSEIRVTLKKETA